ncbi:MAG: diacylglycerol kinase family protein [Actinomycetota bacterium]
MTTVGVLAHSAKSMGGGLGEFRKTLATYGFNDPLWFEVEKSRFIPDRAKELVGAGADLIFVWGGDGTVQQTIDTLTGSPVSVAIMPAGTANLLATNLGIPKDLEEAVKVGLHGTRRELDLGKLNGEHFAVMGGAGMDALMLRDADAGLKDKVGRIAYAWTGAKNVDRAPVKTRIDVDGERWFKGEASCVLIGNVGDVFGGLAAFPEASPEDGLLNIGVVTADGAIEWARTLSRAVLGDASGSPFVETTTGKRFDVRFDTAIPYEMDGSDRTETKRLKVRVKPAAITICVPEVVEK